MATTTTAKRRINTAYDRLLAAYGRQDWWPADTPFEVCAGAILTQSTSWTNVEKAVRNLKTARLLSPEAIVKARKDRLAALIRPSLYYNVKARKLKEFSRFLLDGYGGKVEHMRGTPQDELRIKLLGVWGIGPESADSILLYALDKPSFVVDAYTKRIFTRLGTIEEDAAYDDVKRTFEESLPTDPAIYNEYHALIVEHGKNTCKTKPDCGPCCLRGICATYRLR